MKLPRFLMGKRLIWLGIVLLLVVGAFFFFGRDKDIEGNILTVSSGDFVQEVSVSGKVISAQAVDLTFNQTGKVANVNVDVGSTVTLGQTLASLDIGTLAAELQAAQANVALIRARATNTRTNVEDVQKQQDALVENAYRTMVSEGLVAVAHSANYDVEEPVISGVYDGDKEGTYKIIVRPGAQSTQGDYDLYIFDLEQLSAVEVLENQPTPLGKRGLYISFPSSIHQYRETIWYVTVPNVKSTSYLANYNAYQEALRTREKQISEAEANLEQGIGNSSVVEAELAVAQAEVGRIQAQINDRLIRAPFSGVVTNVPAKVGSIVSPNQTALSMIGLDSLQIESYVPEINIPYVKIGDRAVVTLDAYGELVPFSARVISIDPAETVRDGVSTYRVKLEFTEPNSQIKSGMTANILITTEEKSNVITVPQGAVINRNGKSFVPVTVDGEVIEKEVVTGSVSSLGQIEIVSGLNVGDNVVLTPQTN